MTYEEAQSIIDQFQDVSFQTKGSGGNEVASLDMLELECFAVNVLAMAMKLKHQWRVRGVHV